MTKSFNASILDGCNLRGDSGWDALYDLLVARVRYLVCSSRISLWGGQEEDIIADIVQEAAIRTFRYTILMKERGVIPYNSLKRISFMIADKCYQEMKYRDGQFVRIPLLRPSSREHAVIFEQVDRVEMVLEKALHELLLIGLAHQIAAFPQKQRRALLIELANRMHFNARPSLIQDAFLKVEIRLQDYQQPLPEDPVERNKHTYQVQLACKQLENTIQMVSQTQEVTSSYKDPNADAIQKDSKLVALAGHLDATAPFAAVSPTFRQTLRDRLLDRLAERWAPETRGKPPEQVPGNADVEQHTDAVIRYLQQARRLYRDPESDAIQAVAISTAKGTDLVSEQDSPPALNSQQGTISSLRNMEPGIIGNDPDLAGLVAYLNTTAPSAVVDPVFRNKLREKLLGTSAEHYVAKAIKEAPDSIPKIGFETLFQEADLVRVVHEIADFPDEERTALLIDLASHTWFDVEPTQLWQAFQKVGIRLQDYESLLPDDPLKWREHNSFLNLAYKRIIDLEESLCTSASRS